MALQLALSTLPLLQWYFLIKTAASAAYLHFIEVGGQYCNQQVATALIDMLHSVQFKRHSINAIKVQKGQLD